MALTYLILNVIFVVIISFMLIHTIRRPSTAWWITLGGMMFLTLIFDNLIIWAGIVGYDASKITGLMLGVAPIEDFFYTLLAVIMVPLLWKKFDSATARSKEASR